MGVQSDTANFNIAETDSYSTIRWIEFWFEIWIWIQMLAVVIDGCWSIKRIIFVVIKLILI